MNPFSRYGYTMTQSRACRLGPWPVYNASILLDFHNLKPGNSNAGNGAISERFQLIRPQTLMEIAKEGGYSGNRL